MSVHEQDKNSRPKAKKRIALATTRDLLTMREREFIGACCTNGFKPTEACRTIGIGGKYPQVMANRMLKRPHVRAEFEKRAKARETKAEITIERIAERYAELAFAAHDGPLTATNVIAALEALGKYKGMFKPDQAVVIPVTFQFLGGPPLAIDGATAKGLTIEHEAKPVSAEALLGPDKPIPR